MTALALRAVILRLGAVVLLDDLAQPPSSKEPTLVPVAFLDFHLHTPWKDIPDWDLCFLDCVVLTLVLADCPHCNVHHVMQCEQCACKILMG